MWLKPFPCTERAQAASLNGVSDAMLPPSIPPGAPAGEWVLEGDDEGLCWVWEVYVPDPDVEAILAVGDAQIAALQADVRARRQVCRRTHGAQFSAPRGIVALARAATGCLPPAK